MWAHAALVAVLGVGAAFDDAFAHWLRRVGAGLLLVAGLASVMVPSRPAWAACRCWSYTSTRSAVAAVAIVYGHLFGPKWHYRTAFFGTLGGWLAVVGVRAYLTWRLVLLGMDQIALGALFFLLALAISLLKTGMPQRWFARWFRRRPSPP